MGIEVICTVPLDQSLSQRIDPDQIDILLLDLDDHAERRVTNLYDLLEEWQMPVLFNDHAATHLSLSGSDPQFLRKLKLKLMSILPSEAGSADA